MIIISTAFLDTTNTKVVFREIVMLWGKDVVPKLQASRSISISLFIFLVFVLTAFVFASLLEWFENRDSL